MMAPLQKIWKSPYFLIGLVIRILCVPYFGSHYLTELFIPFLDAAVLDPLSNPWSRFPPHYFPYGSVLFLILFIPRWICYLVIGKAALGTGILGLATLKLSLLALDIILLSTLLGLAKEKTRRILLYYWLNPIVIYISFIHGQLDIAAMCFSLVAIALLIEQRTATAAVALAAGTLCKFHVVAIAPLMMAYLWNRYFSRRAWREISLFGLIWLGLSALGFLPLIAAQKLSYVSASSPEALRIFGAQLGIGAGQTLYLGEMLVLLILGRLCASTRMSHEGLLFGCGAVFGGLLIATQSMPGWYFWVIPFFALLFALYLNIPRLLYLSFVVSYLAYFLFLWNPQTLTTLPGGIAFTALQTSLGAILLVMWVVVLKREAPLRFRLEPMMVGLSGDSGAGKNHLTELLIEIFNPRKTVVIEGDDYHKWERMDEKWQQYTHLSPSANHLDKMEHHLVSLQKGTSVEKARYDHQTGRFTAPTELRPSKTVIIQGLHTLYLRGLRDKLDLKIFLAPDPRVQLAWKIRRDVGERGHSLEQVMSNLASRKEDAQLHIVPQRKNADWIVEYIPQDGISSEEIAGGKSPNLMVRYTVWNDAPLSTFIATLRRELDCRVTVDTKADEMDRVSLLISGDPTAFQIRRVAQIIFPNLRHITRGSREPQWRDRLDGVAQLMAVTLLGGRLSEQRL